MVVTMQGNPLKLYGKMLKVGDKMPDFEVVDNGLAEVKGADLHGVRVFACVPSLDTGVCDMEIRNFNKKAANDLIDEAAKTLTHAKAVHDDIEKYYVGAMNFDKAKEVEKAIIDEISKI